MNKNKKKKKKYIKKGKIIKSIVCILILLAISFGVYTFLNTGDEETNLSIIDKQWIDNNKNTLINIKVPNNLLFLGNLGEGVIFDFINELENDTGIKFNKISYNYPTQDISDEIMISVLKSTDQIKKDDFIITSDNYILVSKNVVNINDISIIYSNNIGILTEDKETVTPSFPNNVLFKYYSNITDLINGLNNSEIDYFIVPRAVYLNDVYSNNLNINYSFSNIYNNIVLRFGNDNKLNTILSKYISKYVSEKMYINLNEKIKKAYDGSTTFTDLDKSKLTSKVYKYGYVKDTSYNFNRFGTLYGIAGEYINMISDIGDITFEYVEYNNWNKVITDFEAGKIDIMFVNFLYENTNALNTISPFASKYAVLSNNYRSLYGNGSIGNEKVYFIDQGSTLEYYLKNKYTASYNYVENINSRIEDDSILLLDKAVYEYYDDSNKLDYKLLYFDNYSSNYRFMLNNDNSVLYNLTNYVLNSVDYNNHESHSMNIVSDTIQGQTILNYIYILIFIVIFIPLVIIISTVVLRKNTINFKIKKKEKVFKYNDILTSLKNRYYLNDNVEKWDEIPSFPKAVVVLDLNNLKYVNDNYGYEEGNKLIKNAAAILINTQLEKTEIMRSDGNEFLIYMIGYSKKQVETYVSKLSNEFKSLQYNFGAAVGYSMIEDRTKNVNDAIAEASIAMREDKEKNYK